MSEKTMFGFPVVDLTQDRKLAIADSEVSKLTILLGEESHEVPLEWKLIDGVECLIANVRGHPNADRINEILKIMQ